MAGAAEKAMASVFDENGSLEALFGDLEGSLMVKKIWEVFEDSPQPVDIPWFGPSGTRNVHKHPINREVSEVVCEKYVKSVLQRGLIEDASGAPWMQYSPGRSMPALALTWNHRATAMYRCFERHGDSKFVQQAKEVGLKKVRMLKDRTPQFVVKFLCKFHNEFHEGQSMSFIEFVADVLHIEKLFKQHAKSKSITSKHPKYDDIYWEFIQNQPDHKITSWSQFDSTKSWAHTLIRFGIWDAFRTWSITHVDFLEPKLETKNVIIVCHALVVLLAQHMGSFHKKETVGAIMLEAMKFCLPSTASESGQRRLPWVFDKGGQENVAVMAVVAVPMATSLVYKKGLKAMEAQKNSKRNETETKIKLQPGMEASNDGSQQELLFFLQLCNMRCSCSLFACLAAVLVSCRCLLATHAAHCSPGFALIALAACSVLLSWDLSAYLKEQAVTPPPAKKARKSLKKVGDSVRKQETFNLLVKAPGADGDDEQAKCAERSKIFLDDFIDSAMYAFADVDASEEAKSKTFSFVASVVLEFAWTSSVVLNGKLFKAWSLLRTEIQEVIRSTHRALHLGDGKEDKQPADLAQHLLALVSQPASETLDVKETEEDKALTDIKQKCMAHAENTAMISSIMEFKAEALNLPLQMHMHFSGVLRKLLLSQQDWTPNLMTTEELLVKLYNELCTCVQPDWIAAIVDASEHVRLLLKPADGMSMDNVDDIGRFLALRSRYLVQLLSDLTKMIPGKVFTELARTAVPNLCKVVSSPSELTDLASMDSLQASMDAWVACWSSIIIAAETSYEDLAKHIHPVKLKAKVTQVANGSINGSESVDSQKGAEEDCERSSLVTTAPAAITTNEISVHMLYSFVDPLAEIASTSGLLGKSEQAKQLGNITVDVPTIKMIERKLEAAMWDHYAANSLQTDWEHVKVSLIDKKEPIFIDELDADFRLFFAGNVTTVRAAKDS